MRYTSSKEKLKAVNERREWMVQSLRTHLLPVLIKQGFEVAPHVTRGPADREFMLVLPLGRLIRRRDPTVVDLMEIEFASHRDAAFRIIAGIAPKDGLLTFTGHWVAEDLYAGWLDECFMMHARPWLKHVGRALGVELGGWFSVRHWPWRSPTQADYDKLVIRVAGYVSELESALREGQLGPHMRKIFIPHPKPPRSDRSTHAGSLQPPQTKAK